MDQRFGHQNQNAARATGVVQTVQDEAGFNGFAQAHLVCEQHPWQQARADFVGDEHLVRQEVHAPPHKTAHRRLLHGGAALQSLDAQIKHAYFIHLSCEQPILRLAEADGVRQFSLRHRAAAAAVGDEAVLFIDVIHHVRFAFVSFDRIAFLETDPAQGGGLEGVLAQFTGGREKDLHATEFRFENHSEAKLCLGVADPTLSRKRCIHACLEKGARD